MIDFSKVPSPCFVMEEERLRENLRLIRSVKERVGVEIILAFKAFALWKSFPIIKEYVGHSTASSVAEATAGLRGDGEPRSYLRTGLYRLRFPALPEVQQPYHL